MASLNKALLIGYVGADPEVHEVSGPRTVVRLRVATNERWTDLEGQKHERTDWHTVIVWEQPAKFCREYVRKGAAVYIEGPMHVRTWVDREGTKRYTTEIVGRTIQLLDRKGEQPTHEHDTQEEAVIAGDAPTEERRKDSSS